MHVCVYVCVCERERERERERETETETETERQRETETDRDRDRDRQRQRETETERQRETETDRQTDIVDYSNHFLFVSKCSWSFPNRSVTKAVVSAITNCGQECIQTDIDTPAARDSYTDVAYATVVTTTTL